ncbi:MAG: ferrochelatase, partial [bacterium]
IEWLNPSTLDKIKELADQGVTHLLVVPIAFVSDHSETLYEIDIELREDAEKCGVTHYAMMPGLNDSPTFIRALADIVLKETQAWLKEPLIAEVS